MSVGSALGRSQGGSESEIHRARSGGQYRSRQRCATQGDKPSQVWYALLNKMKLTRSAKTGLASLSLGLGIFLAVAIWLNVSSTVQADIPMPMRPGTVTRDFTVDYDDRIYRLQVRFGGRVSEAYAVCLLGGAKSDVHPDLKCNDIAPLLKFSWEFEGDGRNFGSGSSADMGTILREGDGLYVMIVGFPAERKYVYRVTLKFDRDASNLAIPPPRIQIVDPSLNEDRGVMGALLSLLGALMCLFGIIVFSFEFFKSKLSRSTKLSGETDSDSA